MDVTSCNQFSVTFHSAATHRDFTEKWLPSVTESSKNVSFRHRRGSRPPPEAGEFLQSP